MAGILIVEDDTTINEMVARNLKMVGHKCTQVYDGKEGLEMIENGDFDLVLLDVMLPGMSGFEIMEKTKDVPVIFVTAKGELNDKLHGLSIGAEDYIVKPFEILELIARINVVLRRAKKNDDVFKISDVEVNLDRHDVFKNGERVQLAPQEYELLEVLILNRNMAMSREKLLELAWGWDYMGDTKTVDVHIRKLRKKLKSTDFTIISNNCWGSFTYQKYGLMYRSPTIGLYILGHDFVKLCSDWENYFQYDLEFISWNKTSYYYALKNEKPFPVAKLKDIEIYFMHYHSEKEAADKWYRRIKRINPNHMIFKLSQREECSKEDIKKFISLPIEHKVCFSYEDIPGTINIPELKEFVGDEMELINKYFDDLDILNE